MIRQAISCDICGAEKKQTNHWFVACEQAGELRVSGWTARNRLRAGTKHLCGQTCLHKLVDEFMARTIAGRTATSASESAAPAEAKPTIDASLTSKTAYVEPHSAAVTIAPSPIASPPPVPGVPALVLPMQPRTPVDEPRPRPVPSIEDVPNYASRRWRAEAWERERALHAVERRGENSARHRKTL